jgi:hypothetical protein
MSLEWSLDTLLFRDGFRFNGSTDFSELGERTSGCSKAAPKRTGSGVLKESGARLRRDMMKCSEKWTRRLLDGWLLDGLNVHNDECNGRWYSSKKCDGVAISHRQKPLNLAKKSIRLLFSDSVSHIEHSLVKCRYFKDDIYVAALVRCMIQFYT